MSMGHVPVLPTRGTPQGGRRREVQSSPLVTNVIDGAPYTDRVARFQIDNPSARLHVKASVVYVPDTADDAVFPGGGAAAWVWTLDAWDRTQDGRMGRANNIFTNRPLPASYEAVTENDQWRGTVTVPADDAGITPGGVLYVIAAWEPAPGWNADPEQLAQIFQACHLRVSNAIVVATEGPTPPLGPDIGSRYFVMADGFLVPGPGTTGMLQDRPDDVLESIAIYRTAGTELQDTDTSKFGPIDFKEELDQVSSDDWAHTGISYISFFRRPNAWKRDYLLKAVTSNGFGGAAAISMPGARVGDTVAAVDGIAYFGLANSNDQWGLDLGSINMLDVASLYPTFNYLPSVNPVTWETTVSVDDQIQQLGITDVAYWLFFLCRTPAGPAPSPHDYLLRAIHGGTGLRSLPGAKVGDTVESVIRVKAGAFAHAEASFEPTITVADNILQTVAAADEYLVFLSRPSP